HEVEDWTCPSACPSSGLLHDERHRCDLVEQTELRPRLRGIGHVVRVHEDAPLEEDTVHVGHHRPGIAEGVWPSGGLVWGAQVFDEGALTWVPDMSVSLVDRVRPSTSGHSDLGMRHQELTPAAVEREAVNTKSDRV